MAEVAEANAYMSKIACRYYRFGICSKGDQCQYLHEFEPKDYNRCSESQHDFNQPSLTDDASVLPSERSDETVPSAGDWTSNANNWVKAWEFVPGQMWRSLACDDGSAAYCGDEQSCDYSWQPSGYNQSCDYGQCFGFSEPQCGSYDAAVGGMVDGIIASCDSTAGCGQFAAAGPPVAVDICDMCGHELPPTVDEQLRQKHTQECIRLHEEEMELSFAVQRSIEKVCGICMEVVWDKEPEKEARFGILSSCCHTFCLSCIRRWRAAQQFDKKTVKSCPECRVTSNFVVPSRYWVDEKDNKAKLIATYQSELSKKHCKYFNRGQGKCPFNDKCFYLHAYPDGRIASPRPVRRRVTSLQQPHRQHGDHAAQLHDGRGDDDEDHGDSTDLEGDDDGIFVVESASLYEIIEQLNERVTQLANQLENSFLYQLLQNNGLGATATSDDDDD